ncbi:protein of unknown function [Lactiplantibacillus plantarum]
MIRFKSVTSISKRLILKMLISIGLRLAPRGIAHLTIKHKTKYLHALLKMALKKVDFLGAIFLYPANFNWSTLVLLYDKSCELPLTCCT